MPVCAIASSAEFERSLTTPNLITQQQYDETVDILRDSFCAVTVFFKRDADLDDNRSNGVCAVIEADFNRLFARSLENDPLRRLYDRGSIVEFSSEETPNHHFQGNLYYFYK